MNIMGVGRVDAAADGVGITEFNVNAGSTRWLLKQSRATLGAELAFKLLFAVLTIHNVLNVQYHSLLPHWGH